MPSLEVCVQSMKNLSPYCLTANQRSPYNFFMCSAYRIIGIERPLPLFYILPLSCYGFILVLYMSVHPWIRLLTSKVVLEGTVLSKIVQRILQRIHGRLFRFILFVFLLLFFFVIMGIHFGLHYETKMISLVINVLSICLYFRL